MEKELYLKDIGLDCGRQVPCKHRLLGGELHLMVCKAFLPYFHLSTDALFRCLKSPA